MGQPNPWRLTYGRRLCFTPKPSRPCRCPNKRWWQYYIACAFYQPWHICFQLCGYQICFEKIHRLSTLTILNKMGLHRNLPRPLVFAPHALGGVGLCNLAHEQGAQQLMILFWHLRAKTPLGQTMEILIWSYQIWVGLHQPILVNTQPCARIPDHWILNIRMTMHAQAIQIHYQAWMIKPLCIHNSYVMEDFADQALSPKQPEQLNGCQMYLQVTTLAKLLPQVLMQSTHLPPHGLHNISHSLLCWPQTHPPAMTCWQLWNKMLQMTYAVSPKSTCLQKPLGPWTSDHCQYRHWHWKMSIQEQLLHQPSPMSPTCIAILVNQSHTQIKFPPLYPLQLHLRAHWSLQQTLNLDTYVYQFPQFMPHQTSVKLPTFIPHSRVSFKASFNPGNIPCLIKSSDTSPPQTCFSS